MKTIWLHHSQREVYNQVANFINEKIGGEMLGWQIGTIALRANGNGDVLGAALLHNFQPDHGTIEVSAAAQSKRWMSRSFVDDLGKYVFGQMGAQCLVARIGESGPRRLLTALGFSAYEIPRLRGRNAAETIMILPDDVWRAGRFSRE